MSREPAEFMPHPDTWTRRDLLDLESLTVTELTTVLDTAFTFKQATDGCRLKLPLLQGQTTSNLFFENSTRTRTSFGLAAKRLGADVVAVDAVCATLMGFNVDEILHVRLADEAGLRADVQARLDALLVVDAGAAGA